MEIAGTFSERPLALVVYMMRRFMEHAYGFAVTQKYNLLLWLPVIFACGIGCYFSLQREPPFIVAACASVLLLTCSAIFFKTREHSPEHYMFWLVLASLTLFCCGFTAAQYRTISLGTVMLAQEIGPAIIGGRIIDIDRMEGKTGSRIILDHVSIEDVDPHDTPQKVRLRIREDHGIRLGQQIEVLGGLRIC